MYKYIIHKYVIVFKSLILGYMSFYKIGKYSFACVTGQD